MQHKYYDRLDRQPVIVQPDDRSCSDETFVSECQPHAVSYLELHIQIELLQACFRIPTAPIREGQARLKRRINGVGLKNESTSDLDASNILVLNRLSVVVELNLEVVSRLGA
jgi:hypothetical protein